MNDINVQNVDGLELLANTKDKTINLILTDPPYIISKQSGMQKHYENVNNSNKNIKTEDEWNKFYQINNDKIDNLEKNKNNYIKYGSIYGKKYAIRTEFGDWDKDFSIKKLDLFIKCFYDKLVDGGTLIIFFDLWKIETLKNIMEKYKFKQIRFIEWIKTNPQPRNSKINYLTNCREIALLGIKKSKPTFNSSYDKGIYEYPIQTKNRTHPTQKNLKLFEELIEKHSNEGDLVMDTFLGSGTTLFASLNKKRRFVGCEIEKKYYDKIIKALN